MLVYNTDFKHKSLNLCNIIFHSLIKNLSVAFVSVEADGFVLEGGRVHHYDVVPPPPLAQVSAPVHRYVARAVPEPHVRH